MKDACDEVGNAHDFQDSRLCLSEGLAGVMVEEVLQIL